MKRLKFLGLFILTGLAASTVLTSCGEEIEDVAPKPTINLTSPATSSLTVETGDSVNFTVVSGANVDLTTFGATVSYDEGLAATVDLTSSTSTSDTTLVKNTTNFTYNGTVVVRNVAGVEAYTFTITDKDGTTNSTTLIVTVEEPIIADVVNIYSAKMMGGQTNTTLGSYMDADSGVVYLSAAASSNSALVDLVFSYGGTNKNYLAAPSDNEAQTSHPNIADWSTKNATKFKASTVTASEFDAIVSTDDSKIVDAASGAAATKLNELAVDQVGAFVTVDGKMGLFKVNAISGTSGADRAIDISVKIQK
ncbi:MAG: hypothetical protein ACI81S_000240 [Sphingobacteriales bacterium]|jgi:hypothetical protein